MKKVLSFVNKRKKSSIVLMAIVMLMSITTGASAAVDTSTVTAITGEFETLKLTALAVVAAIAGIALTLFAAPFAWQYGKKIFKTVAR